MKILTLTHYYYYGSQRGVEPQFYYLYKVPLSMGMEADFFDYGTAYNIDPGMMRRTFLSLVRSGKYDAVFIATSRDEFDPETLREAGRHCPVFGWNSDDEWRWDDYSSRYVSDYTFMVTNSDRVWRENKDRHPNLLRYQWACTGFWDGTETGKDIDCSFVGQFYALRRAQCAYLKKHCGLQSFGKGSGRLSPAVINPNERCSGLRRRVLGMSFVGRLVSRIDENLSVIDFDTVNALWNRSRVSFTPLENSRGGDTMQIKSRVFDMGLSGTVMLAQRAPDLDAYYEPDREYVTFSSMAEAADKVRFLLRNESARAKIAAAYAARTKAEHMWSGRIRSVLGQAGLKQ